MTRIIFRRIRRRTLMTKVCLLNMSKTKQSLYKNCILHNKQKDCFLMLVVMLSKLDLTSHHGT